MLRYAARLLSNFIVFLTTAYTKSTSNRSYNELSYKLKNPDHCDPDFILSKNFTVQMSLTVYRVRRCSETGQCSIEVPHAEAL